MDWRVDGGLWGNPPIKPEGYDLWKYGPELPLENVEPVRCHGGNLVKVEWMIKTNNHERTIPHYP